MSRIRIKVGIDPQARPELYAALVVVPPRARATRLTELALAGLVAVKHAPGPAAAQATGQTTTPPAAPSRDERKATYAKKLAASF